MNHLITLPLLIALFTGVLLLFMARADRKPKRIVSVVAMLLVLLVNLALLRLAALDQVVVYRMGNWPAPFSIVLVLDRLSAMMLVLTSVLALPALIYGIRKDAIISRNYHALFHFQLLGIQGAFLTGDLFNLFVFFEVLLISSYALLMHGGGLERTKASLHYVILNLTGSAFFLIAVGTLYGLTGSLNIADLVLHIQVQPEANQGLILAAGLLLLLVFGLKAALLPLNLWLPNAYSSAAPSIAALFAIMTKVGIYAILRVHGLLFNAEQTAYSSLHSHWLWWLALATLAIAIIGLLASRTLKRLISYLVIISVGTALAGIAMQDTQVLAGVLYYLVHSTLIAGGLFLLADLISEQRGSAKDYLTSAQPLKQAQLLGALFMLAAITVSGLPPLSGFIGKALILQGSLGLNSAWVLWLALLVAGLASLISLSRAGSTVFWRTSLQSASPTRANKSQLVAAILLLAAGPLLSLWAQPVLEYMQQTAAQTLNHQHYVEAVLGPMEAKP